MSLTLADVKAGLQARGYGTDTDAVQTTFIQGALRRVYGMRRWRFLLNYQTNVLTTADDPVVDLAGLTDGDIGALDSVRYIDPATDDLVDMDYSNLEELVSRDALDSDTGRPEIWSQQTNTKLRLWPTPDAAYLLLVVFMDIPALPAVDADVVLFPVQHAEVIVEYATMLMARRQRDWQAYNAAKADFAEALQDMIRAEGLAQRQTAAEVQRWSGWDQVER